MEYNAELHIHLEGCVWDKHIQRWYNKSNFLFPPPKFSYSDSFEEFLAHLRFRYNYLNSIDAYCEVFKDYLDYCFENNITYSELQINKALLNTWDVDLKQLLINFNIIKKEKAHTIVNYIIDIPWQFPFTIIEEVLKQSDYFKDLDVVAIGIGGDERLVNIESLKNFRNKITSCGLKLLCHIGESYNQFAETVIEILRPDRIAHGVKIIEWLIENYIPKHGFDICISSNIALSVVSNIESHPINRLIKKNIAFTLSTDDPAIFNITLIKELEMVKSSIIEININMMKKNINKCVFDEEGYLRSIKNN